MDIARAIKQIHGEFAQAFTVVLQKYDLTAAQIDMLHFIQEQTCTGEPINQRAIETSLRLKNPTVTGTLNRLEAKGFITRRPDPRDGRSKLIELTQMEQSLRDNLKEEHNKSMAQLMKGFSKSEKQTLCQLLRRALENMTGDDNKL